MIDSETTGELPFMALIELIRHEEQKIPVLEAKFPDEVEFDQQFVRLTMELTVARSRLSAFIQTWETLSGRRWA